LTLIISQLTAGGAERVISTIATHWAERGQDVTLVTLSSAASDFYRLPPQVQRVGLDLLGSPESPWQRLYLNMRRLLKLRAQIRDSEPDVVISFGDRTNVLVLLATRGLGAPVIVSERTDPALSDIGTARSCVQRCTYRYASAIVVQSASVRSWAEGFLQPEVIHVIPNPAPAFRVDIPESCIGSAERIVLGMGRLAREKQFDYLLRAFARCRVRPPGWSLLIVGEGPEKPRLRALAAQLGIAERVTWLGEIAEPERILARADLFVLPSLFEGFPNVLLEAMAYGVAVVSFDCPSGPRHIIRPGVDGVLVPAQDLDALATAMETLMTDTCERRRLGGNARQVTERFRLDMIMAMWEDLLTKVAAVR
jgi:glycosyltransferase involved in cell wall biosynthesis